MFRYVVPQVTTNCKIVYLLFRLFIEDWHVDNELLLVYPFATYAGVDLYA